VATTRTPGITVLADGRRFIDKRHLGVRIGPRVGAVTQAQAEERLDIEIARVQCDLARKAHASPTFTGCAARYVAQSRSKRSIDVIKRHVTLLLSYIGDLEPLQIHDQTLEPFMKARLADDASATTINRSLEVVRAVLNRAARSYRDAGGRPWLEAMPPLIKARVTCGSLVRRSLYLYLLDLCAFAAQNRHGKFITQQGEKYYRGKTPTRGNPHGYWLPE